MKIQLLDNPELLVSGYIPVLIENNTFKLDQPDNSIDSILIIDTLEKIEYDQLNDFLIQIRKMLRLKGSIIIRGIDITCLSRDLICNKIDIETYNSLVFNNNKSLYNSTIISNLLKQLELTIDYITLKGVTYELQASRSH